MMPTLACSHSWSASSHIGDTREDTIAYVVWGRKRKLVEVPLATLVERPVRGG